MYYTIKRICDEKGISIKKLEQNAGLGNGIVGGWRDSSPNLDSLEKVAAALGVKTETLIKRSKENKKE